MESVKKSQNKTYTEKSVKVFLTIVCTLILIPFYVVFSLACGTWKCIVYILFYLFKRKEFLGFLPPISSCMAIDDFSNPTLSLILSQVFDCNLNERDLLDNGLKFIDEFKEARCTIKFWLGYPFWAYDKNFSMFDHFSHFNPRNPCRPVSHDELIARRNELLQTPFPPNICPWQCIFIKNYIMVDADGNKKKVSASILRLHHCVADGFTVFKSFQRVLFGFEFHENRVDKVRAVKSEKKVSQIVYNFIFGFFELFFNPFRIVYEGYFDRDDNKWIQRIRNTPAGSHSYIVAPKTMPVQLDRIKMIKKSLDQNFTTVLTYLYGAAIKTFMIRKGIDVPEKISNAFPCPVPGHPDHILTNHLTSIRLSINLKSSDPIQVMNELNGQIEELKTSSYPFFVYLLYISFSYFPTFFVQPFLKTIAMNSCPFFASMSNFPELESLLVRDNFESFENTFIFGLFPQCFGLALTSASIRLGSASFSLVGSNHIFKDEDETLIFLNDFEKEIENLENLISKKGLGNETNKMEDVSSDCNNLSATN